MITLIIHLYNQRNKSLATYETVIGMFLHVYHHKMLGVEKSFHNGRGEIMWNLAISEP